MTRAIFRRDRHLYLSNCVINVSQPPASVIMRAKYPYQILTIDQNCEEDWCAFGSRSFWEFLGKSITHVRIESDTNISFASIAMAMPLVKSYKLTHESLTCFYGILTVKDKFLGHARLFENLEEIICKPSHFSVCSFADIEFLRQSMPKLRQIDAEPFGYHNQPLMSMHPTLNSIKFAPLYQYVGVFNGSQSVTENMNDFLKQQHPAVMKLHYKADRPNYTFLATALKNNPNIREVHLECMEIPIFPCPQMTVLKLKIVQRHLKFEQLNYLRNLRSFELECEYEGCSFSHVPLRLPKLETLKIKWTNCTCNECYVNLTGSFPNLKRLEFQVFFCTIPSIYIQNFILTWPLLEYAQVKNFLPPMTHQKLSGIVQNVKSNIYRPYLRHLDLQYPEATSSDIIALHNICPNLHTLKLTYDSQRTFLSHIVASILPRFKNLSNLHIHSTNGDHYLETTTLDHILRHGSKLRALTLPDIDGLSRQTILNNLFKHLPQLNSFSSYTPQPICAASNSYTTRQMHLQQINCVLQLSRLMHHRRQGRYY